MHRVLQRQLKHIYGGRGLVPVDIDALLSVVSRSYEAADRDRELMERSMDLSSQELSKINASLETTIAQKTQELAARITELEDARKAMLNVLEDVQKEKMLSETLATDLKKFQLAIENTTEQVFITKPDGNIIYVNPAFEKITGYSSSDILGKSLNTWWDDTTTKETTQEMWGTLKDKKSFSGDITKIHKGGGNYETHLTVSPVLDENEEISFFVAVERDITKEKQVDRAKTEFVSLASHQLRTPLSAINWYTEMLVDEDAGELNPEQKKYLGEIYTGSQRMVALINALLNVSQLELGTFVVEPEMVTISSVAKAAGKELLHTLHSKKQTLTTRFEKVPKIYADPKLLHILFQNLLSNAVKYTPEKGTITLTVRRTETQAIITIQDTGMGIPQAEQDKIFSKLFRAQNVRTADTKGTGLGLYLVKEVVTILNGSIDFESEERVGTIFTIRIPLQQPPRNPVALGP